MVGFYNNILLIKKLYIILLFYGSAVETVHLSTTNEFKISNRPWGHERHKRMYTYVCIRTYIILCSRYEYYIKILSVFINSTPNAAS